MNLLTFMGGVPRQLVSDNLRAGITRACFYEPLVNRTYGNMASHYGTAVIPARPFGRRTDQPRLRSSPGRKRRMGAVAAA